VAAGAGGVGLSSEKNGIITRLITKNKIQTIPRLKIHGVSIGSTPSKRLLPYYIYASLPCARLFFLSFFIVIFLFSGMKKGASSLPRQTPAVGCCD
jgi:hypothetical protein